jgi:uncharacterized protein (UPF0335 family)
VSKAETIGALGANAKADIQGRAKELAGVLDEIAELQERAKEIKSEAKLEGYDMKAFGQVVKEMRRGAEYQAAQLTLELTLDTYRKGVDLPTTLEEAQERARAAGAALPDDREAKKEKSKSRRRDDLN